jgi:hypothetical protein
VGEKRGDFRRIKCTNLARSLNRVGMKKKKAVGWALNDQEVQLIEQLRQYPEMMDRVRSILKIASQEKGPLKNADEVEELLIEEMRRLGHATMSQWATRAEERVSTELKSQDASVRSRKKKG